VAAVSYTIVNVMLRAAAPSIDAVLGSLLRLVPVALAAWTIVLRDGARPLRPGAAEFLGLRLLAVLALGGATSFVLGNVLYFAALTEGGLGIAVAGIQAGTVIGGLWLGLLALRETPRTAQLAGAAIIVAGLFAVGWAQTGATVSDTWWLGLLAAFGAGTTYAIANTASRYVQRRRPLLFVALAVSSLGGAVPLALLTALRAATTPGWTAGDAGSIGAVLAAGVANALALAALALAVRHAPVASVNTISSAAIVLSFVASVVVFGEPGSPVMVAGVVLVTAGIVVAQLRRRSTESASPIDNAATPDAAT
jgi:drug/metabolite transporter (DMT)-like permease